ncbi:MAG: hypothetical protein LBF68_05980 [Christensenellaceae bacterium]|jgi:hypothetical protein|nr:hypothetical protein [Christensenellaceae bacterium]
MSKKTILFFISFLVLVCISVINLASCNDDTDDPNIDQQNLSVLSATSYVDYANLVKFDTDTYPELEDQGLFWAYWNNTTNSHVEVAADSEAGASLIDPAKPTIIMVHGMMTDGHKVKTTFWLMGSIASTGSVEFGLTGGVSLVKLWLDAGWNVGMFHYNRFASESIVYANIEKKIWSTDTDVGLRFKYPKGSYSESVSEYCLAEHFAAEYARAVSFLPDSFGNSEIRFACHSMGGQLTAPGLFLITELVRVNQIPSRAIPNRYAMLDPFFGAGIQNDDGTINSISAQDIYTRWNNTPLINNRPADTMIECIRVLKENNIVTEYYGYQQSFLVALTPTSITKLLKQLVVYTYIDPHYENYSNNYNFTTDAHGALADWYYCSIVFNPPINATREASYAASASTSTEHLKTLVGTAFLIESGASTITVIDDIFVEVSSSDQE